MKAQRGPLGLPASGRAVGGGIEGDDEAFIATPREAHAEKLQIVEHRGQGLLARGLQDDPKQA